MIDSHHHLWEYSPGDYPWIPKDSPLAQSYLIPELEAVTRDAGVSGTVVVQARQIIEESDWLILLADSCDLIRGIVGWVPLIREDVREALERLARHPKFKGVRHVLQDEPGTYFLRDDLHRGLAQLPFFDLRFDLLILQRQLHAAIQLVDRQPEVGMIVDHIAKPEARNGRVEEDWKTGMRELSRRDNILGVKFSGLVTEFRQDLIPDPATIRAYFFETMEIFGTDRVMIGTDWPVCLLRLGAYRDWIETVRDLTADLSSTERLAVEQTNCQRCYGL